MTNTEKKYHILLVRLNAVRKKQKIVSLLNGALIFLAATAIAVLFAKLVELIFELDSSGRLVLDGLLVSFVFLLGYFKIARPLFSLLFKKSVPDDVRLAENIGHHFTAIGDRLANALQVYRLRKANPLGYSPDLIHRSLDEIYRVVELLDFREAISTAPVKKGGRLFAGAFVFYITMTLGLGQPFKQAEQRLLHPFTDFKKAPEIILTVSPGNSQALKNDAVEIIARVAGKKVKTLELHLKEINNEYHSAYTLLPRKDNEFSYFIEHIQDTTEYYFTHGDFSSDKFLISVIELPLVRQLQLKIIPPKYSNINETLLEENVGDINCLKGSYAEISLQANKALTSASLVFADEGREVFLTVDSEKAGGGFRIYKEGNYHIKLVDDEALENKDPIEYRISIIDDIFPNVYITLPGQDVDLTEDLMLPLTVEAEDDFGFTSLRIGYRIIKASDTFLDTSLKYLPLPLAEKQREKVVVNYIWDLTTLNLFPGDVIRYYAEIFDNDVISGPKSSKSLVYSARFPTLEEIFAEVSSEQEETYESFEGLYERSKELKENIDKLVEELKQNPELKWEEKKQVEEIVKNQQQLEKTLEEIQQQIDQTLEKMEKNELLSPETLQKYSELQKLLQEVMTDELKEALKKLQKAVEQIDQELLKQALEELNFSQEEFTKNIEKTLNILKRLQIEQKLDELVKKAEQLLEQQMKVNENLTDKLTQDLKKELANKQAEIKQKTSDALSETNQLKNKMNEFADMPAEKLQELLEQMSRDELLRNMDAALSNMKSGKMQTAQQHGKMAESSLSQMRDMLSQAKKDLIEKQKQEVMSELRHLARNFLTLSKDQERLINQSKKLNRNSPQLTERADTQQNLLNALSRSANRLSSLSQKTFFVTPQLNRAVGQSMKSMAEALSRFEERNLRQAARSQQRAMLEMNEAIKQMLSAMKQLSQSNSATGLEEFMEKLSQMAGKQQGINQKTLQLGTGQQPLSLSQQAAMARLAAEQAALKKAMEQLQQEFGERSEILGRLDQIGKEMAEVVKDLQGRKISRRTINRQQKILQRLLDAQKSARRQDYSRKRKAETGKRYRAINPGQLPQNLGEKNLQIQRDLLKAMKEGYSKDYQQLIKKYFEALMKESVENAQEN